MEISKEEEQRYSELQEIALDFAREGNCVELEKMIKHGLSVNLSTFKNDSLLMLSTYNGHYKTSKMLILNGADLDRVNSRGQTPLEGVCFKGNLKIVQLLVENGAKITDNAMVYAAIFGNKDVFDYLKQNRQSKVKDKILGINMSFIASVVKKIKSIKI